MPFKDVEYDIEKLLGEPYLIPIILFIDEAGEAPKSSDFRAISRGEDTIARVLNELSFYGFVTKRQERTPRITYLFTLTEKGERLAALFRDVKDLFYEPLDNE